MLAAAPTHASPPTPFGHTVRSEVGVNIHFTDAQPGEMDMLSGAGFGFVRMDFIWQSTETAPGVYDFSHYDRLLGDLEKRGMRALWILDYGNPLYDGGKQPYTDAGREAFAKWAVAAVTHFKGHHILWEMWNEPNYSWSAPDYITLALVTGQAIRQAEPGETYIGPAEAGTDPHFLETCFQAGLLNYWQAVSVHPYRVGPPEAATREYTQIRALIAKYEPAGANIPVISGEWGYTVMPAGHTYSFVTSDALQASYFDREVLTNLEDGIPLSIWYDWRNDGDNPADTESNFGLVRHEYQAGQTPVFDPKPSYLAAKTLLTTLGDYRFSRTIPVAVSPDALLFSFATKHDRRYAAYTTSSSPETVVLPIPVGNYTVLGISGNVEETMTADRFGLPLTLTGDPQFVIRAN
jgi:polysaccharide biosynthesis protein PslG